MDNEEVMEYEEVSEVQDQPVFVCNTVIDVDAQLEASKAAMGKTGRISDLILYLISAAMVIYLAIDSIRNSRWQQNAFTFILIGAVMVFILISRKSTPKKAMARWEEAIIKKYGSPALHINTEFYELSLAQSLREDEEQFICAGYSTIIEIVETENLFLLRHGKNQYYFVSKKGFTLGTADQFRSFMMQRIGGK